MQLSEMHGTLRLNAMKKEKFSKIRVVIKDTVVIQMRRWNHMFKT